MTNMLKTIVPKSDQLNADDLIGGQTKTIKVTKVSLLGDDQPVAIGYEGDSGKPYKPCKSMRRVLVNVWGSDGTAYIGRSMTLYRDDKVKFGGAEVGGIRISHMSDIATPMTMALTATKSSRKPFTVQPLGASIHDALLGIENAASLDALKGIFGHHYKAFTGENRNKITEAYERRKTELTPPPKGEKNDEEAV